MPVTASVLPIPYAEPPSTILMSEIAPVASISTLAVAYLPVVEPANPTNFAL